MNEVTIWHNLSHLNVLPLLGIIQGIGQTHLPALVSPWCERGNVYEVGIFTKLYQSVLSKLCLGFVSMLLELRHLRRIVFRWWVSLAPGYLGSLTCKPPIRCFKLCQLLITYTRVARP